MRPHTLDQQILGGDESFGGFAIPAVVGVDTGARKTRAQRRAELVLGGVHGHAEQRSGFDDRAIRQRLRRRRCLLSVDRRLVSVDRRSRSWCCKVAIWRDARRVGNFERGTEANGAVSCSACS
jgi:hypothetical protein